MPATYSRRAVLARLGAGGVAAATGALGTVRHAFAQLDDRAWYILTDAEARFLAALGDVIIPEDDWPSASQAGVVDFIDFQLASAYGRGEQLYMQPPFFEGTEAQGWQSPHVPRDFVRLGIEAMGQAGYPLADMGAAEREQAVSALAAGDVTLRGVDAGLFWSELLGLTKQGYFADPIYGGNQNYAGWRMVGFPGAHAYYLSFVDLHNTPYPARPMGIAHRSGGGPGGGQMPRILREG